MYTAQKLASGLILLGAITCTSRHANADVILQQRCSDDSLDVKHARLRLEWARTCALKWNTNGPSDKVDSKRTDKNGAILWEYIDDNHPNRVYTGNSFDYAINTTVVSFLYAPIGEETQSLDSDGFWRWTKPTLKVRPLYPTYNTTANVLSGQPLWPHPMLADCNLYTNKDGTGPVASQYYVVGYCEASCYTPEQEILFPDGYQKIQEAVEQLRPDMVTLTPDSTLDDIELKDNLVYSYTAEIRDTTNVIYEISTASGELRVTDQHPVIRGDGKVVQARTLRVGDDLIRVDGSLDSIVSVKKTRHFGKVYNIRPVTHDPVSNILVAQGYLVGSSTFQNDDVGYINRMILGHAIPEHLIPR